MAAKHDDFDDFFGDDDDTPVFDTRADGRLYRVPLGRLAPNLVNPRTDFGTEDELIDFGKSLARRQNQACPVVSRGAYLKLWPEHQDRIGDVDYILVSGERRYRAATAVGLPALNCVVDDGVAVDRRAFMEAVVSENVDRQNFDPVEEAYAVQALVAEFGTNRAVAQHFERADGWVTQRILLTNLAAEVQDLVRKKTIPLEAARTLGKLARDNDWSARDQMEWWASEQERRTAVSAARAAARRAGAQDPSPREQRVAKPVVADRPVAKPEAPSFTAVKQMEPVQAQPPAVPENAEPRTATVDRQQPPAPPPAPADGVDLAEPERRVPEQPGPPTASPQDPSDDRQPAKPFPYHDGLFAGQLIEHKMELKEVAKMYEYLGGLLKKHGVTTV